MNVIKNIYKPNILLKEYFNNLFQKKYDCRYYQYIFSKLIGNSLLGTNWIIEKSIIDNYDVNQIIISSEKITKHTDLELLHHKLEKIKRREDLKKGGGIYNNGYS